ncbi:integrase domain-containing protein [Paraglaciecola sp. MB-3u-78]|uniref:integrase domain-containing protein n=1 Tax=Paraglaciecola sp. MB-3u-78 TaxID=2058332 RepID=UPI000C33BCF1|nr:integrase domain-containing protein [Paraglaciecola sp. MB-3u-78]PKG97856.1 integrase [Paraglaciecola sp. MB-3u-78]
MARQTLPINPTQLTNIKPKEKEFNIADGGGLMLRVKPSGAKSWLFNYCHPITKKRSNLKIGTYPVMSLAQARVVKQTYLALLEQNIDPKFHREEVAQQKEEAQNNTFKLVAVSWMDIKRTKVKVNSADKIWRSLENDVFPRIGKLPIDEITAPKAIEVLNAIVGRDSYEIARKVARRMNNVMTYAVNIGLVHHNPLTGIKETIPARKVVNYPTLKPDELPELMRAINFASIKFTTRCLLEWQLHSMVRPSEASQALWSDIDYERKLWVIPAERMKMGKEHHIPLSDQALAILELMQPFSGHRAHIFPSNKHPHQSANKETANMALKRMGFAGRLVAHGMRALASTTLNEQGFDSDVIEAALAHGDKNQIRAAYNRATYLEKRKVMMQWWSDHIEQAATGNMSLANAKQSLRLVNQ